MNSRGFAELLHSRLGSSTAQITFKDIAQEAPVGREDVSYATGAQPNDGEHDNRTNNATDCIKRHAGRVYVRAVTYG